MPEEYSAPQARVEEMRAQVFRLLPQKHPRTADTAVSQPQGDLHVAPSTQGPRHVPRAWHCFGIAYPLLFFLFPVYRGMPLVGGGYDMSIAYGAADAPQTPGFSSYFALLHDEA